MFVLFNILASIVVAIVGALIHFPFLGAVYSLAIILPGFAVAIRRMHDIDRSGFWLWIALVPIVGFIVLIVFAATPGTIGDNKYGPDPKGGVPQAYGSAVA